jgi:hypothetical protein
VRFPRHVAALADGGGLVARALRIAAKPCSGPRSRSALRRRAAATVKHRLNSGSSWELRLAGVSTRAQANALLQASAAKALNSGGSGGQRPPGSSATRRRQAVAGFHGNADSARQSGWPGRHPGVALGLRTVGRDPLAGGGQRLHGPLPQPLLPDPSTGLAGPTPGTSEPYPPNGKTKTKRKQPYRPAKNHPWRTFLLRRK